MNKENIFLKIITYGPLIFVPLIVGTILFVFIKIYNESYQNNLEKIKQELYLIEKKSVENKVKSMSHFISYKKSIINENLKNTVKKRVEIALLQAENIYEEYKNHKSNNEIKDIIKKALRPLVWNQGESFIWIVDYNGIFNMAPTYLRHLEGSSILNLQDATNRYIIKEEIKISKSQKEGGFLWDTFTKPNDPTQKQYKQIAFVKSFGHFNWYFGSGEYIDTATKKTDQELLETIHQIDSINKQEHYLFLFNTKGDILINKTLPDEKNIKKVNHQLISSIGKNILNTVQDNEVSFMTYQWLNPNTSKMETKHSYIQKIPNTQWIIGSGFYLSDIQNKLLQKTVDMNKLFSQESKMVLYFAILIMLLSLIASFYISRKLKNRFIQYEKNITSKNEELNTLNNTLEYKVEQRTNELEKMKNDLEKLATTDVLTQIHNRYSIMNILNNEMHRSKRYNTPLSLIIFDIDFFKKVNDTYGHDVGDKTLFSLSQLVQKNLREIDQVGRYGGEEFLIVLPNTTLNEAKVFTNRLRKDVEIYPFEIVGSITISLGLVEFQHNETLNELFKRADNLLYKSKGNGRNKVSF